MRGAACLQVIFLPGVAHNLFKLTAVRPHNFSFLQSGGNTARSVLSEHRKAEAQSACPAGSPGRLLACCFWSRPAAAFPQKGGRWNWRQTGSAGQVQQPGRQAQLCRRGAPCAGASSAVENRGETAWLCASAAASHNVDINFSEKGCWKGREKCEIQAQLFFFFFSFFL